MVAFALIVVRVQQSRVMQRLGMTRPPEVLAASAGELLRKFGVPEQSFRNFGFEEQRGYFAWIYVHDRSPKKWERVDRGLPLVTFWLREDTRPQIDFPPTHLPSVDRRDPIQTDPGSSTIAIDSHGRLISLRAIPTTAWKPRALDWNELLVAAGFSPASFAAAPPAEIPSAFADARMAWTGKHPADGTPIRIEAAAFRGVPVSFRIIAPWDAKDLTSQVPFGTGGGFELFMGTLAMLAVSIGALLAWRNLRLRRGDRHAAVQVAMTMFVMETTWRLLTADHRPLFEHERMILLASLGPGLVTAVVFGLLYLAVEPYIRRRWPDRLISWARLLGGQWRDPMIGRDVLIGITAGLLHSVLASWGHPDQPFSGDLQMLGSPLIGIARCAFSIRQGVFAGLMYMTLLMLLIIVLRRRWLAVAGIFALQFTGFLFADHSPTAIVQFLILTTVLTFVVARYGMLATTAAYVAFFAVFFYPLPDALAWYTARGLITTVFLLALTVWAFLTSLGGQRAFAANLLDD